MIRENINISKNFACFIFSQTVSNIGDAFQLIAVTTLLVKVTGSGISAAFGIICSPVVSILFSALAGYISDLVNEKVLLVVLDIIRSVVALLFISQHNIVLIYVLILLLSLSEIFYNPPKRKFLTGIIPKKDLVTGNTILNGMYCVVYIICPVAAGFSISKYGTDAAFLINSASFLLSAVFIFGVNYRTLNGSKRKRVKEALYEQGMVYKGVSYCMKNFTLRKVIIIGTILSFTTTSVNIAFYPFAFDMLHITDKIWGIMMSIFYGAGIVAVPLLLLVNFETKVLYKFIIPLLMVLISSIWYMYGIVLNINSILILQALEGTILSLINTLLTSHIQSSSSQEMLGRVVGINDLINNIGKIIGIIFTYTFIAAFKASSVFTFCSFILLIYVFFSVLANNRPERCNG